DNQRAVERTAPSSLDGVADALDLARFAENAMVKLFAARGRPLQQLGRAVDRDAFLVPGNQERDRSTLWPAVIGGEVVERRRDKSGDAALHIGGAASIKFFAGNFAGKRRVTPRRLVARRHDVGMGGGSESW